MIQKVQKHYFKYHFETTDKYRTIHSSEIFNIEISQGEDSDQD